MLEIFFIVLFYIRIGNKCCTFESEQQDSFNQDIETEKFFAEQVKEAEDLSWWNLNKKNNYIC